MPKCTESWDNCSGVLDCAAAAVETAAKCTASAAKEAAGTAKKKIEGLDWQGDTAVGDYFSQSRDYYRAACKQDVLCAFEAWKSVKASDKKVSAEFDPKPLFAGTGYDPKFDNNGELKAKYLGWPKIWPLLTTKQQLAWELLVKQQVGLCANKYNTAADLKSLSVIPVVGSILDATANLNVANQAGYCMKQAEGLTEDRDFGVELLNEVTLSVAKASGLAPSGALSSFNDQWKKCVSGDKQACKDFGSNYKNFDQMVKEFGGTVLDALLKEFGVNVPPEVANVLSCIENSMGTANVAQAAFEAVSGNAEAAAKKFAPHVLKCAGQEAIDKLGPGPLQSVLKKALALATAVAFQPPPSPPPLPVLDCSVAGFNAYANAGDKASLVACYATQGIYGEQANQLAELFVKSNKLAPTQLAKASWLGDLSKVDLPEPPPPTRRPDNTALGLLVVGGLLLAAAGGGQ